MRSFVMDSMVLDVKNTNGRLYPEEVVRPAIERIAGRCFYAMIGMDHIRPTIPLEKIAARVECGIEGKMVRVWGKCMMTAAGQQLDGLLDELTSDALVAPLCGWGSLSNGVVSSDYSLIYAAIIPRSEWSWEV